MIEHILIFAVLLWIFWVFPHVIMRIYQWFDGPEASPVDTVSVERDDLRELILSTHQCAVDLRNELENLYSGRMQDAEQMRRYTRDVKIVDRAQSAIQKIDTSLAEPVFVYG